MKKWTAQRLRSVTDLYVRQVLARDDVPHVNEVSAIARMTAAHFSNLFLRRVGMRPSQYIKQLQIECAKRLLVGSDMRVNRVGYNCGFRKRRTFFRAFKRIVGVTPGQYRAAHRS